MSISGIEALMGGGFSPTQFTSLGSIGGAVDPGAVVGTTAADSVGGPSGPQFGQLLTDSIQGLEGMNDKTDSLAVQAATGDLSAIQDYTIASSELGVATQLTVAVRNKAVEAFNEIMRMQL